MTPKLRRAARQTLNAVAVLQEPLYSPPGHFYSPISSASDGKRGLDQRRTISLLDGVKLRAKEQLELAEALGPRWCDFEASWLRYRPENNMYGLADAAVYYSILCKFKPARIIEVGSGFSSAAALDARDTILPNLNLTFIEPYPDRLLNLLNEDDKTSIRLYRDAVQDVPLSIFDALDDGDVLFIDSTHVSKPGSDVNWLFFAVLPRLKPGVIVHIHDIFFPFEYPDEWLIERRSWNEAYLLRAFLTFNSEFELMFFNSWIWQEHPEVVQRHLPAAVGHRPGGIWLRRAAAAPEVAPV